MRKSKAIELLGGDPHAVADAIGVTYQAVMKWPEDLSKKVTDRVQAALWRKSQAKPPRRSKSSESSDQKAA